MNTTIDTTFYINTIRILLGGRRIVGRVYVHRNAGSWNISAFVANADGIGRRDTLLASVGSSSEAVILRNAIQDLLA
jgi:hypothetical protein